MAATIGGSWLLVYLSYWGGRVVSASGGFRPSCQCLVWVVGKLDLVVVDRRRVLAPGSNAGLGCRNECAKPALPFSELKMWESEF